MARFYAESDGHFVRILSVHRRLWSSKCPSGGKPASGWYQSGEVKETAGILDPTEGLVVNEVVNEGEVTGSDPAGQPASEETENPAAAEGQQAAETEQTPAAESGENKAETNEEADKGTAT